MKKKEKNLSQMAIRKDQSIVGQTGFKRPVFKSGNPAESPAY
jgi:hypothetical protein